MTCIEQLRMTPWFYDTQASASSNEGYAYFALTLHIIKWCLLASLAYYKHSHPLVADVSFKGYSITKYGIGIVMDTLIFVASFLFEYSIWCSRMNYLLNTSYTPYITKTGEYYWIGKDYGTATDDLLTENNCPTSLDFRMQNDALPASGHVCHFLGIPFSADLLSEGTARFSVGLALCIVPILQGIVLFVHIYYGRKSQDDNDAGTSKLKKALKHFRRTIGLSVLVVMIASQQSCVMMVLSLVTANPYCAYFNLPPSGTVHQILCLYKWAVAAIPFGVPMLTVGFIFYKLSVDSNDKEAGAAALCGAILLFFGICFMGFWLFAGACIGLWLHYANVVTQRIFVMSEFLSTSGFILTSIFDVVEAVFDNNASVHVAPSPSTTV